VFWLCGFGVVGGGGGGGGEGDTHRRLVEEESRQFRSYFLCKIITLIKAPG